MNRSDFRRHLAVGLVLFGFGWHGVLAAQDAAPSAADDAPPAPPGSNSVERVGFLRPNLANPSIDAPYTLVDANGKIFSYVRPAAGLRIGKYVNHRIRVRGDESPLENQAGRVIDAASVGSPEAAFEHSVRPLDEPVSLRPTATTVRRAQFNESLPPPVSGNFSNAAPGMGNTLSPVPTETMSGPMMSEPVMDEAGPAGMDFEGPGPGPSVQWGGPGAPGAGQGCSSCGGCGKQGCGGGCGSCNNCNGFCGPPGFIWVRAEYLYWWTSGMSIPPLVTTGPSADNPGIIGQPGTKILDGGNRVDGYGRSGGRLTLGTWLNACQTIGIEGDYFALNNGVSSYSGSSLHTPFLARPFYDTSLTSVTGVVGTTVIGPNAELVAEPGVLAGTVSANTWTVLQGAGIRGRFNVCCKQTCSDSYCLPSLNGPAGSRLDFLIGYRYLQLRDSVSINENLTTTSPTVSPAATFLVNDGFTTRNQFNGVDLGASYTSYRGRWSLEFIPRMALGYNYQVADINGSTSITQGGVTTNYTGGLLAQSTNIGHYTREQFAVVPELAANLGFQLTPRLRLIGGYTFMYWSQVSRAGDIINPNVNASLVPNAAASGVTPTGDLRYPTFAWNSSPFWAQGVNVGLDYRW